jgi:hypothetical protein
MLYYTVTFAQQSTIHGEVLEDTGKYILLLQGSSQRSIEQW